jgi:putative hydrolase of the HAD superfamily
MKLDVLAFDADDTLWHNESIYRDTQAEFLRLLSKYQPVERVEKALGRIDIANVPVFGYGIKAFTLSMIETAIEVTEGKIPGSEIEAIINLARNMLKAEIRVFDHVHETLAKLSKSHALMVITKGDLLDQEDKLRRSGLLDFFQYIEVVGEKNVEVYQTLLKRHGIDPQRFLMVGNSLKSDILPVLALGGKAVYIPYHLTWAHEVIADKPGGDYVELEHIGLVPEYVQSLLE